MIIRRSSPRPISKEDIQRGGMVTICYKVGYDPSGRNTVVLIALSDGLILHFKSHEALCKDLNEDDVGFRPMTKREITSILGHQGNRF